VDCVVVWFVVEGPDVVVFEEVLAVVDELVVDERDEVVEFVRNEEEVLVALPSKCTGDASGAP